ncbi:MAG: low molecular weight protein arginine phosphatase [Chloroflexi bacterium]|nr:low molecular weight protein arginine phosphatase [Chloroflexota bacterium]
MITILFVCTGNQFRSPIAAAAFREQLTRDGREKLWQASSAGTWTRNGMPAPREAVDLAHSVGLNIEGHSTQTLDRSLVDQANLILVMEAGHKESILVEFPSARGKTHLLAEVIEGNVFDIPDPASTMGEAPGIIRELVDMVRNGTGRIYQLLLG